MEVDIHKIVGERDERTHQHTPKISARVGCLGIFSIISFLLESLSGGKVGEIAQTDIHDELCPVLKWARA